MSAINPRLTAGPRVLADVIPASWARDIALVVGGAAFTGLCAQVSFTILSISPVPYTLQTFAVLLVGASMGWLRGALSMVLYLIAGLAGVGWFAGGVSGYDEAKVTMGYLVGFIVAAMVVGWLSERGKDRHLSSSVTQFFVGSLLIYLVGVPVLMSVLDVPLSQGLEFGLYPFVLTDTVKLLVAAGLLPLAWKVVNPKAR